MPTFDLPALVTLALAALFALIGAVQLLGPRLLREAYSSWEYSQNVRVMTGFLDIAAAVMLLDPALRGWGIALAAILIFGSVVTLLNHRQYVWAAASILMMAALLPATLSLPRENQVQFAAPAQRILADTR